MLAGAGPARGPGEVLVGAFPPFTAARIGVVLSFGVAVSASCTSRMTPQRQLPRRHPSPSNCRPASACDFVAGADVFIYEPFGVGGAHEVFSVSSVDAATNTYVALAAHLPFGAGSCRDGGATDVRPGRLRQATVHDAVRSDVAVVDHVASLRFAYHADPRPGAVSVRTAPTQGLRQF